MRALVLALLLAVSPLASVPAASAPAASAPAARATAFTVTSSLTPAEVFEGETARFKGRIKPVRRTAKVMVQLKTEEGWTTVAQRRPDAEGRFSAKVSQPAVGAYTYRAKMPRVGKVGSGVSPQRVLTVTQDPIVVFHIPAGTAGTAWNTAETAVQAEVGQTLRVFNDDDEAHLIHTNGSPFPHQNTGGLGIVPGSSVDFPLTSAFDGWLYCHMHGTGESFWITVTDPAAS